VKVRSPTVVERGELIVVEFPENDEQGMTLRDLIARTGKLEFKVVDDGSEYMKKVFAKVGLERDGAPTDPRAIADEIRAEVDQWRDEGDGSVHADHYLIAHDRMELVTVAQARAVGCVGRPADDGQVSCVITGRRTIERYIEALGEVDPMYKVPDENCVFVEGMKTKFGGGASSAFGTIYDDVASAKRTEPMYKLRRIGIGKKKGPARKSLKERRNRAKSSRGKEKAKKLSAAKGKKK
jgi:ribosomal protein S24E